MINNTKICVAICNYNHSDYLKQSIESILSQNYENLDIPVVDDGSNDQDNVAEIVKSFSDKRLRFIKLEKNTGKWNALNLAISTSDAEIFTSHDADDISLPWRIKAQFETMLETNTIHNLCGFKHCWSENDLIEGLFLKKPDNIRYIKPKEVLQSVSAGFTNPSCNHYHVNKFETAGASAMFAKWVWNIGFRFNPPRVGLRILHSEDSDFNCRVTLALQSTSVLAETPYLYRRNTSTNKEEV